MFLEMYLQHCNAISQIRVNNNEGENKIKFVTAKEKWPEVEVTLSTHGKKIKEVRVSE